MFQSIRRLTAAGLLAAAAATATAQVPTGSALTYQGKLQASGAAVTGAADFQFRLFDSATGGNQVGSTQTLSNVGVVDGLFTSRIDFGAGAFNGDARYLEIAVRSPAGTGSFATLTPRQALTAAPYASFAAAPWLTGGTHLAYSGSVGIEGSAPPR